MLSQFSVKNYKSFRDEMTFDMQAVAITEHVTHLIGEANGEKYLPIAAIYGPNGGGKSNVLEALQIFVSKVLRPIYVAVSGPELVSISKSYSAVPFAFSEASRKAPTEFELFFRTETSEYRYILHVKEEDIIYEQLDRIKKETGRKSALFSRNGTGIELKGVLGGLKISDGLSATIPLLSYLGITYGENEIIKEILDWFKNGIDFLNYGNPFQELRMVVAGAEESKRIILKMIKEMDLDIDNFRIEKKENGQVEIFTTHIVDGVGVELKLEEESSGTRKIFGLLPYIVKSIVDGTVLLVDELDAKVHPALLKYIIGLYTNPDINRNGAQLIYTSHDLSTMNNELFRRDEIWFVAKGNGQNSKLYSLFEFKNEKG